MGPNDYSDDDAGYDVDEGTAVAPQKSRSTAAAGYSPRRLTRPEFYQQGVKYVERNIPPQQPRPAPVQEEVVYQYKELTPRRRQQARASVPTQPLDLSSD